MMVEIVLLLSFLIFILLQYLFNKKEYFRVINLLFKLPQASKLPVIGVALKLAVIKENGNSANIYNKCKLFFKCSKVLV